jgi:putative phosphoesterase
MIEKPIPVVNGSRFNRLGTTPEDIILISDLHLPLGHWDSIWDVLDAPFKRLIINGDLFDWRYISDLTAIDREIISKLEDLERQGRLIAIRGNNERLIPGLSRFTSLRFVHEHLWLQQGKILFATHGHQFVWFFDGDNLKRNAVRFAKKRNIDAILVGHNHLPEIENENGILYGNSGSFNDSCCTCLVITGELVVRLVQFGEMRRK